MNISIEKLQNNGEAKQLAIIMSTNEPWITLKRDYTNCLQIFLDKNSEIYVAKDNLSIIGFIIIEMQGVFSGYIRALALQSEYRNRGIGSTLIKFAEEKIFKKKPNVFICTSSFNPKAQILYKRLGYEIVGELKDFIITGASEILMRKSIAPLFRI